MSEALVTDLDSVEPEPIAFEGQMEDGIYFGLPEADYHAAPALSNSGIKWLLVSPLDFWARSFMNPDRDDETTDAMANGKRWHKRIVEGRDAFYAEYVADLDPDDYPDALRTANDLKAVLKERNLPRPSMKRDLIAQVQENIPEAQIWDVLKAEHAAANAGKELVPPGVVRTLEYQAAMIEKHDVLAKCFTGGYPEVSVFWHDASGVPMKARLDYVKIGADIDLKTASNPVNQPIDRAISRAMGNGKYHIQVAVYDEAMKAAQRHIREGRVFGEADAKWLDMLAARQSREFVFVFQMLGVAPLARARRFPKELLTMDVARTTVRQAITEFEANWRRFGSDPWVDLSGISDFADEEFPVWMTMDT